MPEEVENRIDAVHRIVGWIRANSYIIRRVRRIGWREGGGRRRRRRRHKLILISFCFTLISSYSSHFFCYEKLLKILTRHLVKISGFLA